MGLSLSLSQVQAAPALEGPLPPARELPCGRFRIAWSPEPGELRVTPAGRPARALWSSLPGRAFVEAGHAQARWRGSRGSFAYGGDRAQLWTVAQTLETLEPARGGVEARGELRLRGATGLVSALPGAPVAPCELRVPYVLRFEPVDDDQLAFRLELASPGLNRSGLIYAADPGERFLGFGEQFGALTLEGRRVPVLTREQGIGRGVQPLTWALNRAGQAGGDWSTSYAAVPHYITSHLRSLCLTTSQVAVFDLRRAGEVHVSLHGPALAGRILRGDSPLELIEVYTRFSGRMRPLPDWMHRGAVIGVMGGEAAVREKLRRLREAGVAVSALFIQDWVGRRKTALGTRLWWNWESDPDEYPDWPGLVAELRREGVRTLSYVNPWLVERPGARRDLYAEARERGFLVRGPDGQVHQEESGGFPAALVDLSQPAARAWMVQVLREQVLASGVSGWMGDFGEALPFDARLDGEDARSFHNRYPEAWAQVQREAVAQAGLEDEVVFFSRSAWTHSPGITRLFWAGDQLPSWDAKDGLRSALTGLLTSGVSGFSLNHSDTGGYTSIKLGPLVFFRRSRELLERWTELNACTAVLRTHEGLVPAANHQVWSDDATLAHFARMSRLFQALFPYRKRLMVQAAARGWPLVRQLWLQFPAHPELLDVREEFLLGPDLLVAPVLRPGRREVQVTLPPGRWVHLWSGEAYGDPQQVTRGRLPAPLGQPALLYRAGSAVGEELQELRAR